MTGRRQQRRERILIIMDLGHATRVYEAACEYKLTSEKRLSAPNEARLATVMVVALRMIFNRPQGWYDTAFRESLKKEAQVVVSPRLTHEELLVVMDHIYALIPPREDTEELQEFRDSRPKASTAKK